MATVLLCGALAMLTHRHWQRFITRLVGDFEQQSFFRFLLRATNRIAFPVSMLLYLILTRFLLDQFGINTAVLNIFTPLLLSLAGIKLGVYVLRAGFSQALSCAWENVFSLFVWGILRTALAARLLAFTSCLKLMLFNDKCRRFRVIDKISLIFQ